MILTHKTGVLLHGTLAKDPVLKNVGQKRVLKFDVKAHSVKTETGSWEGLYVQVNVWQGLDKWDGLIKGRWLLSERWFGRCRGLCAKVNEILHPPEDHHASGLDVVCVHVIVGLAVVLPALQFPGVDGNGIARTSAHSGANAL